MKLIETTVAELVAFARCEHKTSLVAKAKAVPPPVTARGKGIATHAIIERKNKNGSGR